MFLKGLMVISSEKAEGRNPASPLHVLPSPSLRGFLRSSSGDFPHISQSASSLLHTPPGEAGTVLGSAWLPSQLPCAALCLGCAVLVPAAPGTEDGWMLQGHLQTGSPERADVQRVQLTCFNTPQHITHCCCAE